MGPDRDARTALPHGYRPRIDCSDAPIDSDDHWLTPHGVVGRVAEVLRGHEATTAGLAEVPLHLSSRQVAERLARWEARLEHLGRAQGTDEGHLYHWTVPELIAHEALHEWWAKILTWPLGWWPWDGHPTPPDIPDHLSSPSPFQLEE